jgi:hypothetical protein
MKLHETICIAIILMVSSFYLLTIRAGQPWADDFAMYISEAKNLAERTPFSATGYIYNPANPAVGPRLYPPIFPLLLVPGYMIGGVNDLAPMKVEIVVFFIATLVVLCLGLGKDLPLASRAAMLAIVGFNPVLWSYKDAILSEFSFTLFLYLALALAERFVTYRENRRPTPLLILTLGALVYLCYGTRTIGIALLPALLLMAAMHWRRNGPSIACAAGVGFLACLIQRFFLGAEATYLDQLNIGLPQLAKHLFENIATYRWGLSTFWGDSSAKWLRDFILTSASLLAALAYLRRVRTAPRIYELFLPLYLGIVLLWPNPGGNRYLVPIFPLYVYYCLDGVETLKGWLRIRRTEAILIPLLGVVLLSYGMGFAQSDFGPFKEGIETKEATELFSFVKSNTSPTDVFIFRRPRAFALFTGRSSSVYPLSADAASLCRYFQTIGATYLIEAPAIDDAPFDEFLKRAPPAKELVFSNSEFQVFHVRPEGMERCADQEGPAHSVTMHLP